MVFRVLPDIKTIDKTVFLPSKDEYSPAKAELSLVQTKAYFTDHE
jgi:hypothetical protein